MTKSDASNPSPDRPPILARPKTSVANRPLVPGDLFRFIYQANPFYLVSAGLILYAQTVIFNTANIWMETAIPVGLIAVYTLLLTATAILIVRLGSVWDDARSILLIILALILVLSVSIDAKTLDSPWIGAAWLAGGLAFSTGTVEGLRRWLRVSLPWQFRAVFHAVIAVFFIYPFVMAHLITEVPDDRLPAIRGILLFPVICAVVLLPLIAVIRRGPACMANTGTPWKWPWFPWSAFGLLILGAMFRTYLLGISFYAGRGSGPFSQLETGFGLYQVIPLALVSMVMLLEFSLERGRPLGIGFAMAAPLLLLPMGGAFTTPGNAELFRAFLAAAVGPTGSPLLIAFGAAFLFYGYAWYRGVNGSDSILCGLLLLSVPADVRWQWLAPAHVPAWLTGAVGLAVLAVIAIRRNTTLAWFTFMMAAIGLATTLYRSTWFTGWHGAIPLHLGVTTAAVLGFLRDDRFARVLRRTAALAMSLLFMGVLVAGPESVRGTPPQVVTVYLSVMFALTMGYCLWYRTPFLLAIAATTSAVLTLFAVNRSYCAIRALDFRALTPIFWGMVAFVVALSISAVKGHLLRKLGLRLRWYTRRTIDDTGAE